MTSDGLLALSVDSTMYDFHDSTEQKNGRLIKLSCFSSDFDEKQKSFFNIVARFSVQNFKVSVES